MILPLLGLGLALAPGSPSRSAGETYELVVAFQGDALPADAARIVQGAGGTVLGALPQVGGLQVRGPASLVEALSRHAQVEAVSPALELRASFRDTDELDAEAVEAGGSPAAADFYRLYQWDIQQVTRNGASWALGAGSHNTVVGIVDSGINTRHPALRANLLSGQNFVPDGPGDTLDPADIEERHGHGSHVAGAVAACGRIRGVGPGLGLRVYRVLDRTSSTPFTRLCEGILAAADDGVDVVNVSVVGYLPQSWGTWTAPDGTTTRIRLHADLLLLRRALVYATRRGAVVVAAAGNDAANLTNPHQVMQLMNRLYGPNGYRFQGAAREVPGTLPGVLTVSATGPDGSLASYSNYGAGAIDVSAPGGDYPPGAADWPGNGCLSAWRASGAGPDRYYFYVGTSMAAPKVAAVAALLIDREKASGRRLTPAQVVTRLQQSARDLGKRGYDEAYGQGLVDAYTALSRR
jgi:lantibiotic leader peptide-processing serine protease